VYCQLRKLKQNYEFEVNLGYIVRPCLKGKKRVRGEWEEDLWKVQLQGQ
jgi:hypothetical protein